MISVIIPTYRNPKCLDVCLRSLADNTKNNRVQIVVVVDGFLEESQAVLEKYDTVHNLLVVPLEKNMGMQYSINVGVMMATNPYVLVVNDDNVFPRNWDDRLCDAIVSSNNTGRYVLTVNQIEPSGPSMFNFNIADFGNSPDSFKYEEYLDYEPTVSLAKTEKTGGIFPFVIEKMWYMAVGGLDTFYDSPNICDWDFFLRLQLLGFSFLRTHALNLYHFGSVATKKSSDAQAFRQKESDAVALYHWKWGAMPHNEPGTNSKLPPDGQFRGFRVL